MDNNRWQTMRELQRLTQCALKWNSKTHILAMYVKECVDLLDKAERKRYTPIDPRIQIVVDEANDFLKAAAAARRTEQAQTLASRTAQATAALRDTATSAVSVGRKPVDGMPPVERKTTTNAPAAEPSASTGTRRPAAKPSEMTDYELIDYARELRAKKATRTMTPDESASEFAELMARERLRRVRAGKTGGDAAGPSELPDYEFRDYTRELTRAYSERRGR